MCHASRHEIESLPAALVAAARAARVPFAADAAVAPFAADLSTLGHAAAARAVAVPAAAASAVAAACEALVASELHAAVLALLPAWMPFNVANEEGDSSVHASASKKYHARNSSYMLC